MLKFALLGERLDYSFSQRFFSALFEKKEIKASYDNLEIADLAHFMTHLDLNEYKGFNVTIPFKTEIIPYLEVLSPEAKAIGAVNTIKIEKGKLLGYNTDAFGFRQSIKPFLNNKHEKALILGTGGASKAVEFVLKDIGLDVFKVSRNPDQENTFSYEEINEYMMKACKVIVNCTPLGTFPNIMEMPACPTELITQDHLIIDLIYNPEKTKFLAESEKKGALILNGYSMLQEQALKSWEIWNA